MSEFWVLLQWHQSKYYVYYNWTCAITCAATNSSCRGLYSFRPRDHTQIVFFILCVWFLHINIMTYLVYKLLILSPQNLSYVSFTSQFILRCFIYNCYTDADYVKYIYKYILYLIWFQIHLKGIVWHCTKMFNTINDSILTWQMWA